MLHRGRVLNSVAATAPTNRTSHPGDGYTRVGTGFESQVELVEEDGNHMTAAEYMALHRMAKLRLLCSECAPD